MKMISGLFETYQEADSAIKALHMDGYNDKSVSVVGQQEVLNEAHEGHSDTAEAAGKGAGIGGVLGLIAGVAPIVLPGVGPIISAGSLLGGAIAGAGVGAAAGGLLGMIEDMFDSEDASQVQEAIKKGHILVAVEAGDTRHEVVSQTLRDYGAYEVYEQEVAREKAAA